MNRSNSAVHNARHLLLITTKEFFDSLEVDDAQGLYEISGVRSYDSQFFAIKKLSSGVEFTLAKFAHTMRLSVDDAIKIRRYFMIDDTLAMLPPR